MFTYVIEFLDEKTTFFMNINLAFEKIIQQVMQSLPLVERE